MSMQKNERTTAESLAVEIAGRRYDDPGALFLTFGKEAFICFGPFFCKFRNRVHSMLNKLRQLFRRSIFVTC